MLKFPNDHRLLVKELLTKNRVTRPVEYYSRWSSNPWYKNMIFTNVPLSETLNIVSNFKFPNPHFKVVSIANIFMIFFNLAVSNSFFLFNSQLFKHRVVRYGSTCIYDSGQYFHVLQWVNMVGWLPFRFSPPPHILPTLCWRYACCIQKRISCPSFLSKY